jgi:hypothetical protein
LIAAILDADQRVAEAQIAAVHISNARQRRLRCSSGLWGLLNIRALCGRAIIKAAQPAKWRDIDGLRQGIVGTRRIRKTDEPQPRLLQPTTDGILAHKERA